MLREGWSRAEKEAYAQKIMAVMRLKNEKLEKRHKEVQRDRERAEEKNSSVTSRKNQKRDKDITTKAKQEREWDKGKLDTDNWNAIQQYDYNYEYTSRKARTSSYSDRRNVKKDDSLRSKSANISKDKPISSYFSHYNSSSYANKNEPIQGSTKFRNETANFSCRSRYAVNRTKLRASNELSYRSHQNLKFDASQKRCDEKRSESPSYSGSERETTDSFRKDAADKLLMWEDDSMNKVQNKQSRIEDWVRSINTNRDWAETEDVLTTSEEYVPQGKYKHLRTEREKPKNYRLGEDYSHRKPHISKEQTNFRTKEKCEQRYSQSIYTNLRDRTNRLYADDMCSSTSDYRNRREGKRKTFNEMNRQRYESEMSDRASSLKESDYPDWAKGRSNSKSSDNSDARGELKSAHTWEEKQEVVYHNYGKGNFNKSKSLESAADGNALKDKDSVKKQPKSVRRIISYNYDKFKGGSKPLGSSDYTEDFEYKIQNDQRSSWKKNINRTKNKFSKTKTEYKIGSHAGNFKDEKETLDCRSKYDQTLDPASHKSEGRLWKKTANPGFSNSSKKLDIPVVSWDSCDQTDIHWGIESEISAYDETHSCDNQYKPNASSEFCLQSVSSFTQETAVIDQSGNQNLRETSYSGVPNVPQESESDIQIVEYYSTYNKEQEHWVVNDVQNQINEQAFVIVLQREDTDFSNVNIVDSFEIEESYSPEFKESLKEIIPKTMDTEFLTIESTGNIDSTSPTDLNCDKMNQENIQREGNSGIALQTKQKESFECDSDDDIPKIIAIVNDSQKDKFINIVKKPVQKPASSVKGEKFSAQVSGIKNNFPKKRKKIQESDSNTDSEFPEDRPIYNKACNVPSAEKSHSDPDVASDKKEPNPVYIRNQSFSAISPKMSTEMVSEPLVLEGKQKSTDDAEKLVDQETNVGGLNLSDDGEWSTVSEEDDCNIDNKCIKL